MSLGPEYFDRFYATGDDPWGFASRWYEQRKYALTLAALPQQRFGRALEVGCSVGVLTAGLAGRCDALTAMDPSRVALERARARVPARVELIHGSTPADWPAGPWDLIVLSEVLYYLSEQDLEIVLHLVERDLAPTGTVVACHWRHPVADYPQTGDAVHQALSRWPRLSRIHEEDFLLDVLTPSGAASVARREGLL